MDICFNRSLLNCVPYVLTCQRLLRAYVLTCQHALRTHVLRCSRLACFACSRDNVPCVLCVATYSRAITTNNKDKFSITCFPYIFVIVLCLFPVKQNRCLFLHFSYRPEAFNRWFDKLCAIKWFDFCLSSTLTVIFKWLIKRERWITMHGS